MQTLKTTTELNLLHLNPGPASPLWKLVAGDRKEMCLFVHVRVFLSPSVLWNKYAQHIYCLYLGEIDGNAGEQNIYHFCPWLIVVLGMVALQREGGGGGVGYEEGGGEHWKYKEKRKGETAEMGSQIFLKCLLFH